MSTTYEVMHDTPEGPMKKRFADLDKAQEYAQGKVFAGGPARITVSEQDEPKPEADPEPEPEEPSQRKQKPRRKR